MTGRSRPGTQAAAFAAHEAIRAGAWDDHLPALWAVLRQRQRLLALERAELRAKVRR